MEFVQLKRTLKSEIDSAYIIYGDDNFVLNKAYSLIYNALNMVLPELNEYKFDGDEIDFEEVVKAMLTMPVMSDKKIVYVNAINTTKLKNIESLIEYLKMPNKSTVLVINAGDNLKLFEKIKNELTLINCNRLPIDVLRGVIVNELSLYKKQITISAINKLCNYCLNDLSAINNEIVKLTNYTNKDVITDEDVDGIVSKSFEFQIYELSEALAKKQSDKCFEIINSLKDKKDNIKLILPTISNHFRRLFYVAISDNDIKELSTMLNVKEFAVKKAIEQSKLFTKRQLKSILDSFIELDYETKQSNISVENAIDYIVLKILNM